MNYNNVVWKMFKIGELFDRSSSLALKKNQKELNLVEAKDNSHYVGLVSASSKGSGIVGYLDKNDYDDTLVSTNKITFDDQWGYTYFQNEPFIITGGHNAILEVKDINLKKCLDANLFCYLFITRIINKITINSGIYGFGYKINNKLDREKILLPLIKCDRDSFIWNIDNEYYTLHVDYIKFLLNNAKQRIDNHGIQVLKEKKEKLEEELKKYKNNNSVTWHNFFLGDLFQESTEHYIEKSKKNYNISEIKTDKYYVAVCAASRYNNGIVGYINEIDDVPDKMRKNVLTKGGFGHVFYQDDWFIKPGGSWGMLNILNIKDKRLKTRLDENVYTYKFLAKILTKILVDISSWGYSADFAREMIMLPILKTDIEHSIWVIENNHYTLDFDYMAYLYILGQIRYYQNKIDNYNSAY